MMNKMMKKVAVLFTVAALAVAGTTASVSANDGMSVSFSTEVASGAMTCCVDGANVRTEPSTNGDICGYLNYGDMARISGRTSNGWVLLENGGYVREDLLTWGPVAPVVDENVNPNYTWIEESNSWNSSRIKEQRGWMSHDNDTFTANVASGYLALRSEPCTDPSNEIAQIENGTMVRVIEYGPQFDYVMANGTYGYVNNDYLAG